MLHVDRLTISYGSRTIINALSLPPIEPGQVTVVIGPNGAGKSTILKAIAGIVPYKGSIRFKDMEVLTMPPRVRASQIGFMPQMRAARTGVSALEAMLNVWSMANGRITGQYHDAVMREALELLDRLDLGELALAPLYTLSGGQHQMASLAQTLIASPAVVLLDEPTSALDIAHQVRVMEMARQVATQGRIVMAVLHDLSLAARYADRIVVLDQGQLVATGAPEQAITPAMLESVYGVVATIERTAGGNLHISVRGERPGPTNPTLHLSPPAVNRDGVG